MAQIQEQRVSRPIFIVVPGIMGTELIVRKGPVIWMNRWAWNIDKAARAKMGQYRGEKLNIVNTLIVGDLLSQGLDYIQVPGYGWLLPRLGEVSGGADVYTFSYDWRYCVSHHAEPLAKGILKIHEEDNTRRIILIGHSMGGLICKKAIEEYDGVEAAITKFLALAVPFRGSTEAVERL